jgi:hypothetical protein
MDRRRTWRRFETGKRTDLGYIASNRRGSLRVLIAVVVVLAAASAAWASAARVGVSVAKSTVTVSGSAVTVAGTVTLSPDTAATRGRVRVVVRLDGIDHAWERRVLAVSAKDSYSAHWKTLLTGRLTVVVRASVSGRPSGRKLSRTVLVTAAVPATTPTTTPTTSPTVAPAGQPLLGLFKLTAGSAPIGQSPSGSYIEMLSGSGAPLPNPTSPAANKSYTTFTPGVDGGLSTVAYEPAPSPAFARRTSGNALANAIVQPVAFEGTNFSIDTNPTDVQTGQPDPIPQIYNNNGTLSGQITAWDAQWNGQSFNQGTPKPDGTSPAPTTALTGTYNAATGAFTLTWRSRIVGGPFNGYSGSWHLAGTFVPATP